MHNLHGAFAMGGPAGGIRRFSAKNRMGRICPDRRKRNARGHACRKADHGPPVPGRIDKEEIPVYICPKAYHPLHFPDFSGIIQVAHRGGEPFGTDISLLF